MVSYMGHDLRMVDASCSGLMDELEPDRFNIPREAEPAAPLGGGVAPFASVHAMSGALDPLTSPCPLPFNLIPSVPEAEVVIDEVIAESLVERDEESSKGVGETPELIALPPPGEPLS